MKPPTLALLLFALPAMTQTPAAQSDTLQSLLAEVHGLRQDIEAMTIASQRVQIALYSLQMQDGVVARATAHYDTEHSRCSDVQRATQAMTSELQRVQTAIDSGTLPEQEAKQIEAQHRQEKSLLEARTSDLQSCQASESDAASRLRSEQARLSDLQDRIDRLDKALEKLAAGK